MSDVVLVVEDQRFHVHRSTLAFWSPLFERMFTTDFKEKGIAEISLPEKKACEFGEFADDVCIPRREANLQKKLLYFLFELANEYQIDSIAEKCVISWFLWSKTGRRTTY